MHVRSRFKMLRSSITLVNAVLHFPQMTNNVKTKTGMDMSRESIMIMEVVTDEDGSLKIGRVEEFTDSKAFVDNLQVYAAARAGNQ